MGNNKISEQDELFFYEGEQLVLELTGGEMYNIAPKWDGELNVGEIVHANDEKRIIMKMNIQHPDPGETTTRYKIYLGERIGSVKK